MTSPDRARAELAAVVTFGTGDGVARWRPRVAAAVGCAPGEASAHGPLALAADRGCVAGEGDVVCALIGRLSDRAALAARWDCPPDVGDAATVAAGYLRLGERVFEELRGEFIALVWDGASGRGMLARDQLGAGSVFVHATPSRLALATDLGGLLGLVDVRPDVDERAALAWLVGGGAPAGTTLYAGVSRLEPGTLLRFDCTGWSQRRYWQPRYEPTAPISLDEAAELVRAALLDVVASQTEGVDRAGVLLSGGLDSSVVAALVREARPDLELTGYSMTFPHAPTVDESLLIRTVAGHLGIASTQMQVLGGGMLGGGLRFLERWGVPCPAPNAVFIAALQDRAAADGIHLMLDGEGGDELFGADPYLPADRLRDGRVVEAWRACRRFPGADLDPSLGSSLRDFGSLALYGALPGRLQSWRRSLRQPRRLFPTWLSDSAARALADGEDAWGWKRGGAPLWWSHRTSLLCGAREDMEVFQVLRMLGASSGLVRRHPLLGLELVELVLSLPPEHALDPVLDRPLARRAMRGRIPDVIAGRADKSLFTPLIRSHLLGADADVVRGLLLSPSAEIRRFVAADRLRERLDAALAASRPTAFALPAWRLAMMECWLRSQSDPGFVAGLLARPSLAGLDVRFIDAPASPASFSVDPAVAA